MKEQSRTNIHSPSSLTYLINYKEDDDLQKWISDGDTTTYESNKETNGKQPSRQIEDSLN